MCPLAKHLKNQGYIVYNWDYESRKFTIEELANQLNAFIQNLDIKDKKINFVTHSLGGIITRYYLKYFNLENLGRVVMLAPPNNGSEVVEVFKEQYWFYKYFGPASITLGTGEMSVPKSLGPVNFPLGIIAGSMSFLGFGMLLPTGNDGIVSIESTKVEGMTEHLVLYTSHVGIVFRKDVIQYCTNFLKYESFKT